MYIPLLHRSIEQKKNVLIQCSFTCQLNKVWMQLPYELYFNEKSHFTYNCIVTKKKNNNVGTSSYRIYYRSATSVSGNSKYSLDMDKI